MDWFADVPGYFWFGLSLVVGLCWFYHHTHRDSSIKVLDITSRGNMGHSAPSMKTFFAEGQAGQELIPIGPVTLTVDEHRECKEFWDSITKAPEGGDYYFRKDFADAFTRYMVSMCLMGRASRFLILWESDRSEVNAEAACQAAAKACAIYPLLIYFFDFGCLLKGLGKSEEANVAFREFLRRHETLILNEMDKVALKRRDVGAAVEYAREQLR